jgi:hypothetical protein
MRLKVVICSILGLMPVYADGDYGDENEYPVSDVQQEPKGSYFTNNWFKFSGNFGFVSNYVYRGQTRTWDGPAAQGEFVIKQNRPDGFYVGAWGSNIDSTTAANGANLQLDAFLGYLYKYNPDLTLGLELRESWFPKAHNSLSTRDKYNTLELIPKVQYQIFTFLFAYSFSNARGVNQNFASTYMPPLKPNGSSRGSWYAELGANFPIPNTGDRFKIHLNWGYVYVNHYTSLNYNVFAGGLSYKLPDSWAGLVVSGDASFTTANKKYYRRFNESGGSKNIVAPKVWLGLKKEF